MRLIKNLLSVCLLLGALSSLTSCASIINGRRQNVTVTSNPVGATVSDGNTSWVTPATISLSRKENHLLTFSKPGFEAEVVQIHRTMSGVVAANLVLGPFALIGWGVDAISGGQWTLVPQTVTAHLRPVTSAQPVITPFSHASNEKPVEEKQKIEQLEQKPAPAKEIAMR